MPSFRITAEDGTYDIDAPSETDALEALGIKTATNGDVKKDTTSIKDQSIPPVDPITPSVEKFGKFVDPFEDVMSAMRQEAQENPTVEERAKFSGVGTTKGVPTSVRTAASFGDEDSVKQAIQNEFGDGVEIRIGESTGELEYKLKGSDKFELVNSPGLDAGDFGSFAGDALPMIGDVGGSVAGGILGATIAGTTLTPAAAPAGATLGTATGGGVGSFAGEAARLTIGKMLGVHDKPIGDIVKESLILGGISTASSISTFGLGKIYQAVRSALKGRKFSGTAEDLGIGANQEADEIIAEINKLADGKFQPRPGQKSGAELRELDELYQSNVNLGQTKEFREIDEANLSALDDFSTKISDKAPGVGQDQLTAVSTAQKSLDDRFIAKNKSNIDDVLNSNVSKVDDLAAKIDVDDYIPSDAGVIIRDVAAAEQDALIASFSPKYAKYSEGEFGQLSNVLSQSSPLSTLSKTLGKEERRLLVNGLQDNASLIRSGEGNITLQQIQETLKAINALKIKAVKGLTSEGADVETLSRVKGALKAERKLLLEKNGRPDLYDEITKLDVELAIAKDSVDRSIIGDLMRVNNGRFVVKDDNILNKILRSDVDSQRIFDATQGNAAARQAIRDSMFASYKKSVFKTSADGTESLSVAAHNRLMDNPVFTSNIQRFFGDADQKLIGQAGEFAKVMKKQAAQAKRMRSRLEKSFGAKVASGDPEAMLQIVFDDKLSGKSASLVRLLRQDPEALSALQFAAKERVKQSIIRRGKLDQSTFNGLFDSANRVANLENLMGKEYVDNLSTLNKALNLIKDKSGLSGGIEPSTSSVFKDVFRAIFAPPLSPKGRLVTAAQSGRRDRLVDLIGEAMKDEEKLKKLVALTNISFESRQAAAILASLGAIELASDNMEAP
jgi:hypothetical protein